MPETISESFFETLQGNACFRRIFFALLLMVLYAFGWWDWAVATAITGFWLLLEAVAWIGTRGCKT